MTGRSETGFLVAERLTHRVGPAAQGENPVFTAGDKRGRSGVGTEKGIR